MCAILGINSLVVKRIIFLTLARCNYLSYPENKRHLGHHLITGAICAQKLVNMITEYTPGINLSDYRHLVLGDISGIQNFIFNVKSEGAAKTLKGRSFFVHALSELALAVLDESLPDNCLLFYNGGGNFYVFCKTIDETAFAQTRKTIQQELANSELYLTLRHTPLLRDFSLAWKNLHQAANREKFQKFADWFPAFAPGERPDSEHWKSFAKKLTRSKGYHIDDQPVRQNVLPDCIGLFGKTLQLDNKNGNFQHNVLNQLPEWTSELLQIHSDYVNGLHQHNLKKDPAAKKPERGDILEFETMGHFADRRTGTDKIAALKMDVDNLGRLFLRTEDPAQAKSISDLLKTFFEKQLLEIWNGTFSSEGQDIPFRENIYIVFAGGDDCMIIGAWDAVFEFARQVQKAFTLHTSAYELTLSAALTVLDSKFPVVRMSSLTEEAIRAAKTAVPEEKNRITVFGNVLTWPEFAEARDTAQSLADLIRNHREPRGILSRLQASHLGYEKLQERAISEGRVSNPAVWRLLYFIRNSKNLEGIRHIVETYQKALIDAVTHKKRFNAAAMTPVAARWAELLTRKKIQTNAE